MAQKLLVSQQNDDERVCHVPFQYTEKLNWQELGAKPGRTRHVKKIRIALKMISKTSLSLFEYWNNARGDRVAPNRFEIEPSNISSLLPETILLERIDSRNFSFRLAGTTICEQFGMELRGKNFLDGFTDVDRNLLEDDFAAISMRGGVGLIHFDAMGRSGEAIRFEVLIMPLTHTQGTLNRCLGSISALSLPEWAGEQALHRKTLLRHEIIWPDGKPMSRACDIHRQAPFLPHVRNARIVRQDRRQFRVYDGGLAEK